MTIGTCPFCGADGEAFNSRALHGTVWWVFCPNCDASGPQTTSEDEAIERWNHRVKKGRVKNIYVSQKE